MNELPSVLQPGEKVTNTWIGQLLRAIRRQTPIAGPGLKAKVTPAGTVLSAEAPHAHAAGGGLHPFAIRFYKKDPSDPSDMGGKYGWKIYLPPGCVSVGGTCEPMNLKMRDLSGHEDEGAYWHDLDLLENQGQQRQETENGETVYYRDFEVIVHAKTHAKIVGVDELDAAARRLFFVEARSVRTNSGEPRTARQAALCFEGDEFYQTIATVSIRRAPTDSGSIADHKYTRTVIQTVKSAISVAGRAASNFDLEWYFEVGEEYSEITCSKVYCRRNLQAVAGMVVTGPNYVEVTNPASSADHAVYARIDVNGAAENVLDVVLDPSSTQGGDLVTWLKLYDMSYNTVKADYRASSLVNVQTFR